jgi:hypothetical protein
MGEAWIALAGTIFGGIGLKVVEQILGRASRKDTTAASLRTELRLDLSTMRTEIEQLRSQTDRLDDEIDTWRTRYFSLLAAVATNDTESVKKHLA